MKLSGASAKAGASSIWDQPSGYGSNVDDLSWGYGAGAKTPSTSTRPADLGSWRNLLRIGEDGSPTSLDDRQPYSAIEGLGEGSLSDRTPDLPQRVKSRDDVSTWAKANKYKMKMYWDDSVSDEQNLRIANIMINAFDFMKAKGIAPPATVSISGKLFNSPRMRSAVAGTVGHTLYLNPKSPYWLDPEAYVSSHHASGDWSSNHIYHPFFHEAAHYAHFAQDPAGYANLATSHGRLRPNIHDDVETNVSKYALNRKDESSYDFMAEVFAKLMAGETPPPNIMKAYISRGGIIPK